MRGTNYPSKQNLEEQNCTESQTGIVLYRLQQEVIKYKSTEGKTTSWTVKRKEHMQSDQNEAKKENIRIG